MTTTSPIIRAEINTKVNKESRIKAEKPNKNKKIAYNPKKSKSKNLKQHQKEKKTTKEYETDADIGQTHSHKNNGKNTISQENNVAKGSIEDSKQTLPITVLYTNADQFTPSKKFELLELVERTKPCIIAVCEVKPKNGSDRTELDYKIADYSLYSVNLDSNTGRGVAVYVHTSLDSSVSILFTNIKYEEACLLEIKLHNNDKLLFGCIYRSPTPSNTSDENNNNLNNLLKYLTQRTYSHICIVGDFNYKSINWSSYSTPKSEESKESKFLETIRDCFLHQHILEPTRARGNDDPSTLDLLLSNEEMQVSDLQYNAPLGKSDHCTISFKYNCYVDFSKPQERCAFHKGDYDSMRYLLTSAKWKDTFLENDGTVEDMWQVFKDKMHELQQRFIPKVSFGVSWRKKGSVPVTKPIQAAIRNKKIAHRQWITIKKRGANDEITRKEFKKARNKVNSMMRDLKRKIERKIAKGAKSNPKAFWAHVRGKLKTKSGIAPLLDDSCCNSPKRFADRDKANILQNQFSSVFTKEPPQDIPTIERRTDASISNLPITPELVQKEIKKLNVNKSCGPDGIHSRMLKELIDHVSEPIAHIFKKSLESGYLPEDWKDRLYFGNIQERKSPQCRKLPSHQSHLCGM